MRPFFCSTDGVSPLVTPFSSTLCLGFTLKLFLCGAKAIGGKDKISCLAFEVALCIRVAGSVTCIG